MTASFFTASLNAVDSFSGALNGVSTTSLLIGTGSKTFTASTKRAWLEGSYLIAASDADVSNYMTGQITSYDPNSGELVLNVTGTGGSGTYADWNIGISGPTGAQGDPGEVTSTGASTDNAIARFDGTSGDVIQNSGATIDDSGNLTATNLSGTNTGDQTITLTGDVTGSGTGSFAATIADDAVTYAKMQNVSAASKLLGRGDSGSGDVEEITLGSGLSMSGTTLSASGGGGGSLSDGDYGDVTVSGSGTVMTIDNDVVTYAKMQNISVTDRLLGRDTAGAGDTEELTVGGGIEFTGTGGIQRSALTGDVTASAGSNSTTIANDAVTYAKLQNISATDRLLGRDTAGAGDTEELTVGGGIEFTGTGGIQRSALTGDVTASAGSGATTIANDAVTYAKLQNVSAASKLLGRGDSGAGDVEEITIGSGLSMSGTTLSASGGPGGADTQVQFNDGGSFGGDAGLTYNKTTNVLTNTGGKIVVAGGTVTANAPGLDLSQTWNNAAVAFTAANVSVTKTAADVNSRIVSVSLDGSEKFYIDWNGHAYFYGNIDAGNVITGHYLVSTGGSGGFYARGSGDTYYLGGGDDVALTRDAADTLALRRGTNAQQFRVYNTYTDASNNEHVCFEWYENAAYVHTKQNGTGGGRDLILGAASYPRIRITPNNPILCTGTDTTAGGTANAHVQLGNTSRFGIYYGSGAPTVSAAQGSLYLRSDGSSTSTRAYINTDGGTTWTAITTAA